MNVTAQLSAPHTFSFVDMPIPDPGPGEVQARIRAIGICGSDLHYFAEGGIGDTPALYPMVLGHEPAGEIVKVGAGVTGWAVGDKAILEPALYCYHCEFCLTGHHNVCPNMSFLSSPVDPGFFREYVNLPVTNLLPIPPELDMVQATLFEPLSVILHSMRFVALQPGETAIVMGSGPIGALTIAALKMGGAKRIWCFEPLPHRRELAKAMGADEVFDPFAVDPVKTIATETHKRGADVSIDCAGRGESVNQCLEMTRGAGRVVITGIPMEMRYPLNFHALRRKELSFFSVRRSNHTTETALEIMRERPSYFSQLITHVKPLDTIQRSFETLEHYEDGVGKIVLTA